MQTNTTTQTNPGVAVSLIQQWKSDPALREKYANDAGAFFTHAEWDQDPALRQEFNDNFEAFAALSKRGG